MAYVSGAMSLELHLHGLAVEKPLRALLNVWSLAELILVYLYGQRMTLLIDSAQGTKVPANPALIEPRTR